MLIQSMTENYNGEGASLPNQSQKIMRAWSNGYWIGLETCSNKYLRLSLEKQSDLLQWENWSYQCNVSYETGTSLLYIMRPIYIYRFILSVIGAIFISKLPIKSQIKFVLKQKQKQNRNIHANATEIARAYRTFRAIRIRNASCLEDSICCFLFLLKFGVHSNIYIAVKDRPFKAHSWIQFEDNLLNDRKERTEYFSVIWRA